MFRSMSLAAACGLLAAAMAAPAHAQPSPPAGAEPTPPPPASAAPAEPAPPPAPPKAAVQRRAGGTRLRHDQHQPAQGTGGEPRGHHPHSRRKPGRGVRLHRPVVLGAMAGARRLRGRAQPRLRRPAGQPICAAARLSGLSGAAAGLLRTAGLLRAGTLLLRRSLVGMGLGPPMGLASLVSR